MIASLSAFARSILALLSLQLSGCAAFGFPRVSSSSSRWQLPASDGITAPKHVHLSRSSRGDTALSMGIRSFIKRKVLRKKDEEGNGADNADVTLRSILQSAGSVGPMVEDDDRYGEQTNGTAPKKGAETGKNNPAREIHATPNKDAEIFEATQDRIRRMKGGGMTEEEKAAFLNNALRGPMQKPEPRGPPIRQKVPGMDDDSDISSSDGGSKTGKESLWSATKKKGAAADISVASLMMDGKMKSEEAKRRYMESITNPDRFATFSTYQRPSSRVMEGEEAKEESGEEDDGKETPEIAGAAGLEEEASETKDDNEDIGTVTPEIEGAAGLEEEASEPKDANVSLGDEMDFRQMKRQIAEDRELLNPSKGSQERSAARDAVESILSMVSSNANKNADPTVAVGAAPPANATTLGARLERAAEVQERRDAEARASAERKREAAERKREDERRAWAAAQAQRAEEERRKEAERAERARKAAEEERRREEERAAKERAELEARQARQDEYWAKKLAKERPQTARKESVEVRGKKEAPALDAEERLGRDETKEVAREKIRNEERAREDDSVSSFVREQRKKTEEIERLRQLDRQSLKSLNSPLPSPGRAPVGMPPSPVVRAPLSSPRPSPDLSLASLTMAKKRENPSTTPKSAYPSPSPPSQRLNLFEMTKLKQGPDSTPSASSSTISGSRANQKPAKRTVRQQLPLSTRSFISDDEEDDDDDDLMRSGAPGLTVADALKQQRKEKGGNTAGGKENESADEKAKKWGIDMSKFK